MSDVQLDIASNPALGGQGTAGDYFALLKPRVMSLVIFTAFVGIVAAPGTLHPLLALVALLAIAVGAGASGALNMWYDADIDAVMRRTRLRPVPRGAILPGEALGFGAFLAAASVIVLGLFVNLVAAALLAFTIFFYVVIYTIWLKRWTPQNIVIGGAAGALPPMIGWAAVTGTIDPGAISLFLIIFIWTPPHFWALALFREDDYAKAGVPMLPNVAGPDETRRQILLYTLALVPLTFIPAVLGVSGLLYVAGVALLSTVFIYYAVQVYRLREGQAAIGACRKLFGFSILWLFLVFALIPLERLLGIASFHSVLQ
ncbi:MAG: protoheme IX farnesyltransferase [Hyphomicrobiales bacterium]|nr:protoheme IX farnesyltransferase [Hyphomicrobiales bacterium]